MTRKIDRSKRSLMAALGASGAAAIGLSFAGGLAGCGHQSGFHEDAFVRKERGQ
jgi:hypothetical protein